MKQYLVQKQRVLFLTTSNRWSGEKGGELPKSTQLAHHLARELGDHVKVLDIPALQIYPCEGNVSTARGNTCGLKEATLLDETKNPSGFHRCWASLNNTDDELWKVSKELFDADVVVFFTSVRWGQTNAMYQKLIERLTWIENRHSTLGEENILAGKEAGIVVIGQNWRGADVLSVQKEVLSFFGFSVPDVLSWHWQFSSDATEEHEQSYQEAVQVFERLFLQE